MFRVSIRVLTNANGIERRFTQTSSKVSQNVCPMKNNGGYTLTGRKAALNARQNYKHHHYHYTHSLFLSPAEVLWLQQLQDSQRDLHG